MARTKSTANPPATIRARGRPPGPGGEGRSINLYLLSDDVAKLDARVRWLQGRGLPRASRSDAIRWLLDRAGEP